MKVLKTTDITEWNYKHICNTCDSELEVEGKDIKYTYHDSCDPREPSYETWQATCPICKESFNIPADKIPKLIRVEAKSRNTRSSYGYWAQFDR